MGSGEGGRSGFVVKRGDGGGGDVWDWDWEKGEE